MKTKGVDFDIAKRFFKKILLTLMLSSLAYASSIDFKLAQKDPNRVLPVDKDEVLSYHSCIKDAKKSVVNISTSKILKTNPQLDEMFNHPFFKDFFGQNFNIPQQKQKSTSLGSGVIISENGYIVTNNHVVEDADEILVTLLETQKEYKAKIVGLDKASDLAVIKIDAKGLRNISFASSQNLLEGDVVFAIGNPFGVGGSITKGIISALNKTGIGLNQYENFIQTDASINPGNSGGALVDTRGALVGINSAILSRSGGNNGIGFAIPSNMVKRVAKALIENGKIERGYMGVRISDLPRNLKEIYTNKKGALITDVEEGKPAAKAGLRRGDLLIRVNESDIKNASELKNAIGLISPKSKIKIVYERDNKIKTCYLELGEMNLATPTVSKTKSRKYLEGLELSDISDKIREYKRLGKKFKGVVVTDVKAGSSSHEAGFYRGDIIVQVEQKIIKNLKELDKVFSSMKGKKVRVWVYRNGYVMPLLAR